jgi:hypothetical protein
MIMLCSIFRFKIVHWFTKVTFFLAFVVILCDCFEFLKRGYNRVDRSKLYLLNRIGVIETVLAFQSGRLY